MTPEQIDQHLDAVLRAAGSALRNYSIGKSKMDMRAAIHAIIAQARAELIAELRAAPAGYLIDWPDEPDLGHYYAEDPIDSGRCQPLAIIPKE